MDLRALFEDDDAVSAVIGVILMVAVTVILAAVIGTFVLGIGSQVTSDTPKVSVGFVYDDGGDGSFGSGDDGDSMTITHRGGDDVSSSQVTVNVAGSDLSSCTSWPSTIESGDSTTVDENSCGAGSLESRDTVRVIWRADDGEGTAILGRDRVP